MKINTTWTGPVAVSLLLHVAIVILLTKNIKLFNPEISPQESITVEFTAVQKNTIKSDSYKDVVKSSPVIPPVRQEEVPVTIAEPEKTQVTQAESQQPIDKQQPINAVKLNVQALNKLTRPPSYLNKIEPAYPVAEQRAGSQATVLAEATIDEKGEVVEVKIVKSAGNNFDKAVIEALNKSKFTPGLIGKDAVAVRVLIPFRFNLK